MEGAAPVLDVVAAGKRNGVPKVVQKKANAKPKQHEEVIEISPDTEEKVQKQDKPLNRKKEGEGPSKKKAPTLTSVLTARSKVMLFFFIIIVSALCWSLIFENCFCSFFV